MPRELFLESQSKWNSFRVEDWVGGNMLVGCCCRFSLCWSAVRPYSWWCLVSLQSGTCEVARSAESVKIGHQTWCQKRGKQPFGHCTSKLIRAGDLDNSSREANRFVANPKVSPEYPCCKKGLSTCYHEKMTTLSDRSSTPRPDCWLGDTVPLDQIGFERGKNVGS